MPATGPASAPSTGVGIGVGRVGGRLTQDVSSCLLLEPREVPRVAGIGFAVLPSRSSSPRCAESDLKSVAGGEVLAGVPTRGAQPFVV